MFKIKMASYNTRNTSIYTCKVLNPRTELKSDVSNSL